MNDDEILAALKSGETLNFGCNGRNTDVMDFMADLERQGLIKITDASLSQETRCDARWIA